MRWLQRWRVVLPVVVVMGVVGACGRSQKSLDRELLDAAARGQQAVVLSAIRDGADIAATDGAGRSPLMVAVKNGHTETVRSLIAEGASVNAVDSDGASALTWAALGGCSDCARLLIENGAEVDHADRFTHSPLHWAVRKGHLDVVRVLVEHGADIERRTQRQGFTPIFLAKKTRHAEIEEYLRDALEKE